MDLTPIDVLDTAIKIGLGSLITAISGLAVLKMTQSHEEKKELKNYYYKAQEERKTIYVNFLSQSQSLVQEHLLSPCNCRGDDYKNYLRIYSEVQIISPDHIRISSYELLSAVNQFIVFDHSRGLEISREMRKTVNEKVGIFQKLAQEDVTRVFSA